MMFNLGTEEGVIVYIRIMGREGGEGGEGWEGGEGGEVGEKG